MSSQEEIVARHKQEKKDLEKRAEKMRSFVPKKDKVGRLRVGEEIDALRKELLERHNEELKEAGIESKIEESAANAENMPLGGNAIYKEKKLSKQQEKRLRKQQVEAEREKQREAQRAAAAPSEGEKETKAMQILMDSSGLTVHEIAPDGDCLFNAVAHQLRRFDLTETASSLRAKAVENMLANEEQYIFFLEEVEGDPEKFKHYCESMRSSSIWGGEVELRALATKALDAQILVYAVGLPLVEIGDADATKTLRVSYHRKAYDLGEHYNSVLQR